MKANWVLNEEEKMKFLNARKKKEPNIMIKYTPKPRKLRPPTIISGEEILEVNEYIKISEYFEMSKVKDMETELTRELIR